jgi:hypothetical protein
VILYILTFDKVSVDPEHTLSIGLFISSQKLVAVPNRILGIFEVVFDCLLSTIVLGVVSKHLTIFDAHVVKLAGHEFVKRMGWEGGGVPPVASNPTTSQGAVPILCPHGEALGARLGEHPILLGDAPIGVADDVATRCLGTRLEGVASLRAGLGEVEQQGGTVSADHLRVFDQQGGEALGVTHEGGEAG